MAIQQKVDKPIGVIFCDGDSCEIISHDEKIDECLDLYLDKDYIINNLRNIAGTPKQYLPLSRLFMDQYPEFLQCPFCSSTNLKLINKLDFISDIVRIECLNPNHPLSIIRYFDIPNITELLYSILERISEGKIQMEQKSEEKIICPSCHSTKISIFSINKQDDNSIIFRCNSKTHFKWGRLFKSPFNEKHLKSHISLNNFKKSLNL